MTSTLLNFTKAVADTGIEQGVRVNATNPGLETRFIRNVERTMRQLTLDRWEALKFLLSSDGSTRFGRPEEVGTMVAYLASTRAGFIQGSIIDVNGGAARSL